MHGGAGGAGSCDPAVISCFIRCYRRVSDSQEDANNSQRAADVHTHSVFPHLLPSSLQRDTVTHAAVVRWRRGRRENEPQPRDASGFLPDFTVSPLIPEPDYLLITTTVLKNQP